MHRGTPVLKYDTIYVFHELSRSGRRCVLWHPQHGFQKHDLYSMKRLDGEEFDPKGVITVDWKACLEGRHPIIIDGDVVQVDFERMKRHAKAVHLLDVPPNKWPQSLKEFDALPDADRLVYVSDIAGHYRIPSIQVPCGNGSVVFNVTEDRNEHFNINIVRRQSNIDAGVVAYDPTLPKQVWEDRAEATIQGIVDKYMTETKKLRDDEAQKRKEGRVVDKVDYAHITDITKDFIVSEFQKKNSAGKGINTSILEIAKGLCPTSKTWRRQGGKNAKASVQYVLVERGILKLSVA